MLANGFKYEKEIREKLMDVWYDPKYQYYFCSRFHSVFSIPQDTGDSQFRYFVSLGEGGEVNGLFSYRIDHECNFACYFGAINFSDCKLQFGHDLYQCIDDIFCKFYMNKLEFSVIIGNPIEKSYDRIVEKMGGRVLGIRRACAKDMAGNYHDEKIYEVMREDYLKAKERRFDHGDKSHDSGSI